MSPVYFCGNYNRQKEYNSIACQSKFPATKHSFSTQKKCCLQNGVTTFTYGFLPMMNKSLQQLVDLWGYLRDTQISVIKAKLHWREARWRLKKKKKEKKNQRERDTCVRLMQAISFELWKAGTVAFFPFQKLYGRSNKKYLSTLCASSPHSRLN